MRITAKQGNVAHGSPLRTALVESILTTVDTARTSPGLTSLASGWIICFSSDPAQDPPDATSAAMSAAARRAFEFLFITLVEIPSGNRERLLEEGQA
jgi:hypothetical protein